MPMKKKIYEQKIIDPQDFDKMVSKLRGFFISRGYLETFPQPLLSILAACEDPKTVRSFNFNGNIWPLPQTSQIWLEYYLLKYYEKIDGVFTLTASYRDEPKPIEGRHEKNFAMFEAEHKGDFSHLLNTLSELMVHLKLVKKKNDIPFIEYNELCKKYNTNLLEADHEELIWKDYGDVVGIIKFKQSTHPFWNMKQHGKDEKTQELLYNKCDLIICGQETFGSAERSIDIEQMRNNFYTISNGMYAKLLFDQFGKERVEHELDDYLSLNMKQRWGFGMGCGRLLRALKIKKII
jgi:aspartyl/asparaginyl-tRNA synthetase